MAALLQHTGRAVVARHCKHEAEQINRRLRATDVGLEELEREVLGCSQATIGHALLRAWGVPDAIAEVVAQYPDPPRDDQGFGPAHAVHVASALAAQVLGTVDEVAMVFGPRLDSRTFEAWGFTDSLEQWAHTAEGILALA